jgi:hypothetical protein
MPAIAGDNGGEAPEMILLGLQKEYPTRNLLVVAQPENGHRSMAGGDILRQYTPAARPDYELELQCIKG